MKALKLIAASVMTSVVTCAAAWAQSPPEGRVYTFHSGQQGACPGLDWHVVANGNNLDGMISWDNMKAMARATGTLNASAKTFEMTAKEVGGQNRTAKITGSITSGGWLQANIDGPGVKCQNVTVQWFVPPPPNG
jgi:hypothetical protein